MGSLIQWQRRGIRVGWSQVSPQLLPGPILSLTALLSVGTDLWGRGAGRRREDVIVSLRSSLCNSQPLWISHQAEKSSFYYSCIFFLFAFI